MRFRLPIVLVLFCLAVPAAAQAAPERQVIGHSLKDRPIVVWRQGDTPARFRVLVVGSVHGEEPQGMRVVSRLRQVLAGRPGPKGVGWWTVRTANPDGAATGRRGNARGVDLNRNFPFRWNGRLGGGYYSGTGPASEPETRAMMRLHRRVGFHLAIWLHQPWGRTLVPCNEQRRWAFLYARLSRLGSGGRCDRNRYPGSAVSWQRRTKGTFGFVVEFGPGVQKRSTIRRHARATIRLARKMSRVVQPSG